MPAQVVTYGNVWSTPKRDCSGFQTWNGILNKALFSSPFSDSKAARPGFELRTRKAFPELIEPQ